MTQHSNPYPPSAHASFEQAIHWVLHETSHPGNIGAVCRAMYCMGFSQLDLVNPRFQPAKQQEEAIAFAGHARSLLEEAVEYPTLEQAIANSDLRIAFTLRRRHYEPQDISIQNLANALEKHIQEGGKHISLLFGNERTGLHSQHIQHCNLICTIPVATPETSLNLAQAVQIVAYELSKIQVKPHLSNLPTEKQQEKEALATHTDLEQFLNHWEKALVHIDYLDPKQPKFLMERLGFLFQRAKPTQTEIHLLRGIAKKMLDMSPSPYMKK
jgi:tRNA/rRNA methyltransferase